MYLRNVSHILTMKNTFIFLIFAALLISSVVSVGSAIAQNQNTKAKTNHHQQLSLKIRPWLAFQVVLKRLLQIKLQSQ